MNLETITTNYPELAATEIMGIYSIGHMTSLVVSSLFFIERYLILANYATDGIGRKES